MFKKVSNLITLLSSSYNWILSTEQESWSSVCSQEDYGSVSWLFEVLLNIDTVLFCFCWLFFKHVAMVAQHMVGENKLTDLIYF